MPAYIGLMSGTSLDGVDGVLVRWPSDPDRIGSAQQLPGPPQQLAFVHADFEPGLRAELLALNTPGADEIHRAAIAANALARSYASVVTALLDEVRLGRSAVRAIGAHGQTVRHRPRAGTDAGYTVQLLNGALLAEHSGIDVVCDFRSRDVGAGGQGAPLVPAFHAACLRDARVDRAVLNLGGIANLTLLPAVGGGGEVTGFDTGPGNLLLDGWCQRRLGVRYDEGGRWAAGGKVMPALLEACLAEPYFALMPPKSTGRDLFGAAWFDAQLAACGLAVPGVAAVAAPDTPIAASSAAFDANVAATLLELTARTVADALASHAPFAARDLYVCGGGAHNSALMDRLRALLPSMKVRSTAEAGIAPERVEALAFAWMAHAFVNGRPANLPAVTGASGPRILGALHPAGPAGPLAA